MTMDELAPGETGRIKLVSGQGGFRRRLLEMGLLPGTAVIRTGQAPLGDPLSFRVRGSVLSLRRSDAATIEIERS